MTTPSSQDDRREDLGPRRPALRARTGPAHRALRVSRAHWLWRCTGAFAAAGTIALSAQPQVPPRFTTSVEVTSIDVTVVDDRGHPIERLAPDDFTVRIDGNARRVVSAEWVPLATGAAAASAVVVPEGYSSNENTTGGRLIVIAVDQPNIRFGATQAITRAAGAFVDKLSPSDRVAVTGFGPGAPATAFSADRDLIKLALTRMNGLRQSHRTAQHNVSLAEAQAIERGDRVALQTAQERECNPANFSRLNQAMLEMCRAEVEYEAQQLAMDESLNRNQTLSGLRDLLTGLKTIDAPKTLILITEGFLLDDPGYVIEVGSLAAAARTGVYALRLEREMFDASQARAPIDLVGDRQAMEAGLDVLVGAARGTVFTITNAGAQVFDRIEAELSGYYLLGVESDARDRDGKPHPIRVDVSRRGATVRTRRQVVNALAEVKKGRSPRDAVTAALSSPLLLSAMPLRVATFTLQGPERSKVQLLIHADVGTDYAASRPVSFGFMLFDPAGRLVDSQAADQRLSPVLNGVPSPLQFTGGASVPPGDYTLRLAVAEGDKVGSVEHPIHAALTEFDGVSLSDLTVGGPTDVGDPLRPTIGYTVNYGSVHGYMEAYGRALDSLTATFEIAAGAKDPALLNVVVPNRHAGDARSLFTRVIPIQQLPAGKYVLRAIVSRGSAPLKILTRAFEISPPSVLMASAGGLGAEKSSDAELFLPVGDALLARPFRRDDALKPETLEAFRARLAPSVRPAFESGVTLIASGEYPKAEASLKKAIQSDIDSTAALAYLAVCFAAAGHDLEAASAFQTSLADGSDIPQIYEWLGETLMRTHNLNEARTLFEEAAGKWPSDIRFTRPLAMLYATFGRGREAVRTLERYLEARPTDSEALYLGVEWIYQIHANGAVLHNRAQDLQLAHAYSEGYQTAGGAQVALVKQWVDYLDNEKR